MSERLDRLLAARMDRRGATTAILGLTIGALYGVNRIARIASEEKFEYVDVETFVRGFDFLLKESPLYSKFFSPQGKHNLDVREKSFGYATDVFSTAEFDVEEDGTSLELVLPSDGISQVELHPVILTVDDSRQFLHPVIQSIRQTAVGTYLGEFDRGIHEVKLECYSNLDREKLRPVQIYEPKGSLVQEVARRNKHFYTIRSDNLVQLYNDTMALEYTKVYVNESEDEVMLSTTNIALSEDDGLKPTNRQMLYGRTVDIEDSVKQKLHLSGIGIPWGISSAYVATIGREKSLIAQVPDEDKHAWAYFTGEYLDATHPIFQIKTKNNLLGFRQTTNLLYSPPLRFIPPECYGAEILLLNPEVEVLGYLEEARSRIFRTLPQARSLAQERLERLKQKPDGIYPLFPEGYELAA